MRSDALKQDENTESIFYICKICRDIGKKDVLVKAYKNSSFYLHTHLGTRGHEEAKKELEELVKNSSVGNSKKRKLDMSHTPVKESNLLNMGAVLKAQKYSLNSNLQKEQ